MLFLSALLWYWFLNLLFDKYTQEPQNLYKNDPNYQNSTESLPKHSHLKVKSVPAFTRWPFTAYKAVRDFIKNFFALE